MYEYSSFISIPEAAEMANVSSKTINSHLHNGTIYGIQDAVSRRWRVDPNSVKEYYYSTIEGENQHNIVNRHKKDSFKRRESIISNELIDLYNTFRSFEWKNKSVDDVCEHLSRLIVSS